MASNTYPTDLIMKRFFQLYPNLWRLILGGLLTGAALILRGMIPIPIPRFHEYFPFMGTLCVALVAWVMYRTEKKNLGELGFNLEGRNLVYLPAGLILGILAFVFGFHLTTYLTGERWNLNRDASWSRILLQLYWILPAAAVQEFIARGYCFKKLAEMTNPTVAIIVCGLLFIAMHDFWNGNIFGILMFATTIFLGHLLFAEAFLKSGTIYFSIGLHWGNNFANSTLFTDGKQANSLFFTSNPSTGNASWIQYVLIFVAANLGFGILTFLIWKWKSKRPLLLQH